MLSTKKPLRCIIIITISRSLNLQKLSLGTICKDFLVQCRMRTNRVLFKSSLDVVKISLTLRKLLILFTLVNESLPVSGLAVYIAQRHSLAAFTSLSGLGQSRNLLHENNDRFYPPVHSRRSFTPRGSFIILVPVSNLRSEPWSNKMISSKAPYAKNQHKKLYYVGNLWDRKKQRQFKSLNKNAIEHRPYFECKSIHLSMQILYNF